MSNEKFPRWAVAATNLKTQELLWIVNTFELKEEAIDNAAMLNTCWKRPVSYIEAKDPVVAKVYQIEISIVEESKNDE